MSFDSFSAKGAIEGEGAIKKIKDLISKDIQAVFLVTGKNSYNVSGARDCIDKILSEKKVITFSDFAKNPELSDVEKGIKLFKKEQVDVVIGVGGGSVLDMAKMINVLSHQKGDPRAYIIGEKKITKKGVPLIAIPTTAGSGSEATHFAVCYIDHVKYSLAHSHLLPNYAIIDPELTYSLPPQITASTGIDALSQGIESYWNVHATDESKKYAKDAIRLALSNLRKAVHNPNPEVRGNMSRAAHLAGKAINITKTTAPHALSYVFTSQFGVPHGHAVGLTLGFFLQYNGDASEADIQDKKGIRHVKKTMNDLFRLLGVSSGAEAQHMWRELMTDIGLETSLSKLGIRKNDLSHIAKSVNIERLSNNPREISTPAILNLLQEVM